MSEPRMVKQVIVFSDGTETVISYNELGEQVAEVADAPVEEAVVEPAVDEAVVEAPVAEAIVEPVVE